MRVVLDTNVLVSALLLQASPPSAVIGSRREDKKFDLLTAPLQIEELSRVTRYPKIRARINSALAGRLVNEMRNLAVVVRDLPIIHASPDPYDNYLLSIAVAGLADFLVTGDKVDLLTLRKYQGVATVSVGQFLTTINRS